MESPGGISSGGISIEPWRIPRFGAGGQGSSNQRSLGQGSSGTGFEEMQKAWSSTGVGGGFGTGEWPGEMAPAMHRGLFGGPGIRTGGGY